MVVYRRETRGRNLLVVLIVAALALVIVDSGRSGVVSSMRDGASSAISPIRSATNTAFQPLRDVSSGIGDYSSLKRQNGQLRRQVGDLQGQVRKGRGIGGEVGQLEKLLDLPTVEDATGIAARVSGGAPGNFERTVQLDKGSSKGIRVGYPVVTGDGLVGTISAVSPSQSTVTLLDNPALGVGVRLESSQVFAITTATSGDRALHLANLSDNFAQIQKGELVFTAAIPNAAFPPDEPVGTVTSYARGPQDLAPTITVAPLVNLDNLDFVKVLRWPDPTAAPSTVITTPGG
jgi:rod shape-determining protein MreC